MTQLETRLARLEKSTNPECDTFNVIIHRFSDAPLTDSHTIKTATGQIIAVHYRKASAQ